MNEILATCKNGSRQQQHIRRQTHHRGVRIESICKQSIWQRCCCCCCCCCCILYIADVYCSCYTALLLYIADVYCTVVVYCCCCILLFSLTCCGLPDPAQAIVAPRHNQGAVPVEVYCRYGVRMCRQNPAKGNIVTDRTTGRHVNIGARPLTLFEASYAVLP